MNWWRHGATRIRSGRSPGICSCGSEGSQEEDSKSLIRASCLRSAQRSWQRANGFGSMGLLLAERDDASAARHEQMTAMSWPLGHHTQRDAHRY